MTELNRPLSPHLQIYRLPLLALVSITHRITGIALSIALLLLPIWFYSIAAGPEVFSEMQHYLSSWYGKTFLFFCSLGLNFHLLNGIRHLFWDAGLNLDVKGAEKSAYLLFAAVILLTSLLWALVYCPSLGGVL